MPRTYKRKIKPQALEGTTGVEKNDSETTVVDAPLTDEQKLMAKAVDIACEQLETSMKFKQPRMAEIRQNEEVYSAKPKVALRNRFNVPFDSVVMTGAIDTILARSDDKPKMDFEGEAEEHKRGGMKVAASFERESSDARGRWAQKDRLAKKMAYLSGRAIFEIYSTSKPKYKNILKVIDHYDFQCEPGGGPFLEDHLFAGTINNFFSKEDLIGGGNSGEYIASEVQKLIFGGDEKYHKVTEDEYRNRQQRFLNMGLDLDQNNYVGTSMFNLVKWVMEIEGDRYYLLFDPKLKICVRFVKLKEMFESNLYPWVSWATHEDALFWSRGFADTIRPVAEVYRVLVNQMLENIQKRNWNNRAYDPAVFPDPSKLLYTPDGLAKANLKPGMQSISQGIYELQTPDTTGVTLNAIEWLNSFLGEKTGITPGAQGQSEDTKVGIYYGNIQQVAERFSLLNKSYVQAWVDLGTRYDWGLYEHMPEDMMVKVIGINGIGWEKLTKEDVDPEYTVRITSTNAEAQENELKSRKQADALTKIQANPALLAKVNPKWLTEAILRSGGFNDEEIRVAMDPETFGDQEVLLKGAESIRRIVDGEWPVPLVRQATTGFVQKILDYATDHAEEMPKEIYDHLIIYAMAHRQYVNENMVRKAMTLVAQRGVPPTAMNLAPGGGAPVAPGAGPSAPILSQSGAAGASQVMVPR